MKTLLTLSVLYLLINPAFGIPMYDEGAMVVAGVQLLRDKDNENEYYYLPQYPHLAAKPDGSFELVCLKYVGSNSQTSGGLFHALVEFTLPEALQAKVEKELKRLKPKARLVGAVRLLEPQTKEGDERLPSFEIVSATLNNRNGDNPFTREVVSSGYAPFTPGSRAAVAAMLNQRGATLLWNSLNGPTSDVSVTVHGYYEAAVKGYNAIVTADMSIIYKHFSEISNKQEGYTKRQIRNVVDSLQRLGGIKVTVDDRSQSLGIKAGEMESILNLVTNKLVEIMFNAETGWAKTPDKVDATLGFDQRGRQGDKSEGAQIVSDIGDALYNASPFGWMNPRKKNENPTYVTDDQYLLKNIKDVRITKFYLNLSKSTTIKVPLHASGNLGGLYDQFSNDKRYFRIVDMNDPDFEKREVNFHLDGAFTGGFDELVNFVSVNFRKKYLSDAAQEDAVGQISLSAKEIKAGTLFKSVAYPRFGLAEKDFTGYDYQVVWSLKGSDKVIRFPASPDQWFTAHDPDIVLSLPFEQMEIVIDADRSQFSTAGYASASLSFATTRAGQKQIIRNVILRANDTESTNRIFLYRDPDQPVVCQTTWYNNEGERKIPLQQLNGTYLRLIPPKND